MNRWNIYRPSRFNPLTKIVAPCNKVWQPTIKRNMAAVKDSIPHIVRTANDPRGSGLHRALISRIELVNQKVRVLRLSLPDGPIRHLPGQYVDLHIPEIETVGGFTITSPPQTALTPSKPSAIQQQDAPNHDDPYPFIELAIQKSPNNPPAAYLWRAPPEILNTPTSIRVGGSFTYPPSTLSQSEFLSINNIVFIAGGVGINPIMSMLSAMDMMSNSDGTQRSRPGGFPSRVRILYSSRRGRQTLTPDSNATDAPIATDVAAAPVNKDEKEEEILFEKRLNFLTTKYSSSTHIDLQYSLFETSSLNNTPSSTHENNAHGSKSHRLRRRITHADLIHALGPENLRKTSLVYICGLPSMTDEFVEFLRVVEGLDERRVLCEKWW